MSEAATPSAPPHEGVFKASVDSHARAVAKGAETTKGLGVVSLISVGKT